jgi:phosphoglycerate-specific signal transduction histidine kinase
MKTIGTTGTQLHRYELMSLLYEKLNTIHDIAEELRSNEDAVLTRSLAQVRHELGQIAQTAQRAQKLISDFEPCEDEEIVRAGGDRG